MKAKLTLSIDSAVIERAKAFAKYTDRSLSGLVEDYLKTITDESANNRHLSPKLKEIVGAVKLPKDFDEKIRF